MSHATEMDSPGGKRKKLIQDMLTFLWPEALPFPPIIENILQCKIRANLL